PAPPLPPRASARPGEPGFASQLVQMPGQMQLPSIGPPFPPAPPLLAPTPPAPPAPASEVLQPPGSKPLPPGAPLPAGWLHPDVPGAPFAPGPPVPPTICSESSTRASVELRTNAV